MIRKPTMNVLLVALSFVALLHIAGCSTLEVKVTDPVETFTAEPILKREVSLAVEVKKDEYNQVFRQFMDRYEDNLRTELANAMHSSQLFGAVSETPKSSNPYVVRVLGKVEDA